MAGKTRQIGILLIFLQSFIWGCAVNKAAVTPPTASGFSSTQSIATQEPQSSAFTVSQSVEPSKASPEIKPLFKTEPKPVEKPVATADSAVQKPAPLLPPLNNGGDFAPQLNQDLPPLEESDLEDETDEKDNEEPSYDIPIVRNDTVEEYINYYQKRNRPHFELWLTRSGRYLPLMKDIFKSFGLPEDLVFLALIESGFNPYAYSRSKAAGPWQFMKPTGKKYGLKINRWIDERRDPIKSTLAAAKYLKDLYAMFGSWPLALASYNAGEGRVLRAMAKTKAMDFWDLSSTRYLRPETKNYVPQFMAATIIAKNPEKYGFSLSYYDPMKFDIVLIDRPTDLRVIARTVHASYEIMKELNPELRKGMTPPLYPSYPLRIPEGTKPTFEENFGKVPEYTKILKQKHRVRRGESLLSISRHFGVPLEDLADTNGLSSKSKIRRGQILIIPLGKADQTGDASPVTSSKSNLKMGATVHSCSRCELLQKYTLYRVKKGDTLYHLSKKYDVEIASILKLNRIQELKTGIRLIIPRPGIRPS